MRLALRSNDSDEAESEAGGGKAMSGVPHSRKRIVRVFAAMLGLVCLLGMGLWCG